eukprot:c21494_g1_i1.p1 GENE.c21494_g1_i1~~c21494_g1_i1.p1  ORF type:complete len:367 (+),score=103.29 c21494_g1_i1:47-1102(+)
MSLSLPIFNIDNGFLEAIARGYHNALLNHVDYQNLMQCEKLEDMKLHLASTTYGNFLQNEPSPLTTSQIQEKAQERLVAEFMHLKAQAVEPLKTFMEYITLQYQIDNMAFLILGAQAGRTAKDLLEKCHPIGRFDSMGAVTVASSAAELYDFVLVETGLGKYFHAAELKVGDLDDLNIEIIRSSLYRAYLEDFHAFCEGLGGVTAEVMCELIEFEADRRAINITTNSLTTELSHDDRAKLFAKIGKLYPEGVARLAKADDMEAVGAALEGHFPYDKMFAETTLNPDHSLEDLFLQHEMALHKESMNRQFSLGIFFSIVRMKEQEIRNIIWIGESIVQQQRDKMSNIIPTHD